MIMLLMMGITVDAQLNMEISTYEFVVQQRVLQENIVAERMVQNNIDEETTKETEPAKKVSQSVFLLCKPVSGGVTTSVFGDMEDRESPHVGHDWAIETGSKVKAGEGGVVTKAYYSESYGYNIVINHRNGIKTRYAHMSRLNVKVGDVVKKGQKIGLSGNTGQSTGPHLHFEVIVNGVQKNPLNYIQ